MKLRANAGALARAVALAGSGMRGNAAIRLVAAEGGVAVSVSDLHIGISTMTEAVVTEPGQAAFSDRLGSLVSSFPPDASVAISTTPM